MSHAVLVGKMARYFEDDGEACEDCKLCKTAEKTEWGRRITETKCIPLTEEDGHDRCPVWSKFERDLFEETMEGGDPTKPGWVA